MATQKQILDNLVNTHGLIVEKSRDKYGRTVNRYIARIYGADRQFLDSFHAVVVNMPKTLTDTQPDKKYLVNDWSIKPHLHIGGTDAEKGISYHRNRIVAHITAANAVIDAARAAGYQLAA